MHYELAKLTSVEQGMDSVKGKRVVTNEEFAELAKQEKVLHDFNRNHLLIEYVLDNASDFQAVISDTLHSAYYEPHMMDSFNPDLFLRRVQKTLLNLMMSLRTFADHLETKMKREYGESSEEFLLFKKLAAEEFDNNFAYAFMAKFRNLVQHCGMPPFQYSLNVNRDDSKPNAVLELSLNRDRLLNMFKKWGSVK